MAGPPPVKRLRPAGEVRQCLSCGHSSKGTGMWQKCPKCGSTKLKWERSGFGEKSPFDQSADELFDLLARLIGPLFVGAVALYFITKFIKWARNHRANRYRPRNPTPPTKK